MRSLVDRQVCDHVARYLRDEVPLRDVQQWLMPATWGLALRAHPLAADVLLRLAEFSDGGWTEAELKRQLADLIDPPIQFEAMEPAVVGRSLVRFVPFGRVQVAAIYPSPAAAAYSEQKEPDEIIRGTTAISAGWPEWPSLPSAEIPVPASQLPMAELRLPPSRPWTDE